MCFKGKLLYCLSVETVSLTLAIINVIANVLNLVWYSLVWGMIIEMYYYRDRFFEIDEFDGINMDTRTWQWNKGHVAFYYFMIPLASLLTAIFSFFLCFGIRNRRLGLVTAYLVYGSLITALGFLASLVLLIVDRLPHAGLWVLFVCVIHLLFLLLILQIHKKMIEVETTNFAENLRLVVEDDRFFKSGGTV